MRLSLRLGPTTAEPLDAWTGLSADFRGAGLTNADMNRVLGTSFRG